MADAAEGTLNSTSEKEDGTETRVTGDVLSTISVLQKGSPLVKCRRGGRLYQRYYYIDTEKLTLAYSGSTKCMRRPNSIEIKYIREIRDDNSPAHQNPQASPEHSFTVVVGEQMKILKLLAPSFRIKDMWVRGLRFLMTARSVQDPVKQEQMWLVECFAKADKNHDDALNKNEIVSLLKSLNVSEEVAKYMKKQASKQKLEIDEFISLYKKFSERGELKEIFLRYVSSGSSSMSISELASFFQKEQQQDLTEPELEDIIARSEQCPDLKAQKLLSQVGFTIMFSLPELNIRQPKCRTIYQDMTQPLNHYFINSSHNTYLEGHQLYGNSSVQQYIRVLTHRCRCVELDVWDGDDDEPVIYHGYTLTSKILFKDALKGIHKHAFKKSEYPVILSLENHCSVKQQVQMAKHLKETFGDTLLLEPLPEDGKELPSPEQLKGRVILKGKKLPHDAVEHQLDDSDSDEAADLEDEEVQNRVKESKKKRTKLAQELSDCIVVCQAVSFKSLEESARKWTFVNMSAFNENKAEKLVKDNGGSPFVQHNAFQLSRVYPAGKRTNSSNYDPVPMWMTGCQVVFSQ